MQRTGGRAEGGQGGQSEPTADGDPKGRPADRRRERNGRTVMGQRADNSAAGHPRTYAVVRRQLLLGTPEPPIPVGCPGEPHAKGRQNRKDDSDDGTPVERRGLVTEMHRRFRL